MITKGVASVRSHVCNLAQFSKTVSHDTFVAAVVDSFKAEYGIHDEVTPPFPLCITPVEWNMLATHRRRY
jgi:lipoate-protein ligase A